MHLCGITIALAVVCVSEINWHGSTVL